MEENFNISGKDYGFFDSHSYIASMQELRRNGFSPVSIPFSVIARLDRFKNGTDSGKKFWLESMIDTADAVAFSGKNPLYSIPNSFKLMPSSSYLTYICNDGVFIDGGLPITESHYYATSAPEFVRVRAGNQDYAILVQFHQNKKYRTAELYELGATPLGRGLGTAEINGKQADEFENSDLWLALMGYDFNKVPLDAKNLQARRLRNEYGILCRELIKKSYDGLIDGLGIYFPEPQTPMIMPLRLESAINSGSDSGKIGGLSSLIASPLSLPSRLVGIKEKEHDSTQSQNQ